MEWDKIIIALIIDMIVTVVGYLLVPVIFCLCKKRMTNKKILKVIIINAICVWLIFQIIRIASGDSGTSGAVFIWSGIGYAIMRKNLLVEETTKEPVDDVIVEKFDITVKPTPQNVQPQKPSNKKGSRTFLKCLGSFGLGVLSSELFLLIIFGNDSVIEDEIAIVIMLLFALLFAGFYFYLFSRAGKKKDKNTSQPLPPQPAAPINTVKISQEKPIVTNKAPTAQPKQPPQQVRFCHMCGNKLVEGSVFCNKCGTKVVKN